MNSVELYLPKLKVDLSFGKAIVILITVFLFLGLPIYGIEYSQSNNIDLLTEASSLFESSPQATYQQVNNQGRVAGVSTTSTSNLLSVVSDVSLTDPDVQISLAAGGVMSFSCAILFYLFNDHRKFKSYSRQELQPLWDL